MSKPWLEEWSESDLFDAFSYDDHKPGDDTRRALAAAAPDLVRALLAVEHPENGEKDIYGKRVEECPSCLRRRDACGEFEHTTACRTDDTLRFVGLPDQASRDEARADIAKLAKETDR